MNTNGNANVSNVNSSNVNNNNVNNSDGVRPVASQLIAEFITHMCYGKMRRKNLMRNKHNSSGHLSQKSTA